MWGLMIPGRMDQGLGNAGIHTLTLWMGWGVAAKLLLE
jgi:hypothetical protein